MKAEMRTIVENYAALVRLIDETGGELTIKEYEEIGLELRKQLEEEYIEILDEVAILTSLAKGHKACFCCGKELPDSATICDNCEDEETASENIIG